MRLYIPAIIAVLSISVIARGNAQGSFQNLNFASAAIPQGTPNGSFVPVVEALPGWSAYFGSSQQNSLLYNNLSTGSVEVALLDQNSPVGGVIPGNQYTVVLQAGLNGVNGASTASIAQTGLIPSGSRSIIFTAAPPTGPGWSVMLGGQNIPVVPESQQGSYVEYIGDISAFAGQTDELRFTADFSANKLGGMVLDNIQFSPNLVPEPSVWSLILCGTAFFGLTRKKGVRD
ncbi:MAG TPA: hypothetical protein VH413_13695 [Verrucomicrobiae bacterium]|jgi:hypothetical protein|nr:hypothetical protein [Verrucomicrobiae bacterium]